MPEIIHELTVFSPAKVNLHLTVKDRRPDGFHDIYSIFLAVNFGDTIHFFVNSGKDEENSSNLADISISGLDLNNNDLLSKPENNIIYKAISLFREKTGFSHSVKVNVEKHIPLGGGLGGGSSNAACALLSLNKMAGFPCSRDELLEIAAALGSDVPFFIYETAAALVTGRGECITPIDAPVLFIVLVNPGFPSNTARAFRLLDKYRAEKFSHRDTENTEAQGLSDVNSVFSAPPCGNFWNNFSNDFLPVFPQQEKAIYEKVINKLRESGAVYANLSGAGSTCFGVFSDEEIAHKAAQLLQKEYSSTEPADGSSGKWFAECCSTLINEQL